MGGDGRDMAVAPVNPEDLTVASIVLVQSHERPSTRGPPNTPAPSPAPSPVQSPRRRAAVGKRLLRVAAGKARSVNLNPSA